MPQQWPMIKNNEISTVFSYIYPPKKKKRVVDVWPNQPYVDNKVYCEPIRMLNLIITAISSFAQNTGTDKIRHSSMPSYKTSKTKEKKGSHTIGTNKGWLWHYTAGT